MRGHIRSRSKGSWELTIELPRKADGSRNQPTKTVRGTKREAEKQLAEWIASVNGGTYCEPSKATVATYLATWLRDDAKQSVSAGSLMRYESIIRLHINPHLGNIPLDKLRPLSMQALYTLLSDNGYSASTVHLVHSVLSKALAKAVRWELLPRSPVTGLALPGLSPRRKPVLDEQQIIKLIEESLPGKYAVAVALAATTGMRAGEICGLRWRDIDFKGKCLTVRQNAVVTKEGLVYKEPKTKGSERPIDLPSLAMEALEFAAPRPEQRLDELVCPFRPAAFYAYLNRLGKRLGLPVSPHTLRHSHASHLMREGVHPKVVSERLGHANIGITMNTYSHLMPSQQKDAARRIDESFQKSMLANVGIMEEEASEDDA